MDRKRRLMENNNGWPLRSQLFDGAPFRLPLTHTAVPASAASGTTATFTRATTATVRDNEGVLRTAIAGEARFEGARMVRNLLTLTEDFSTAVWSKSNASMSANQIAAPNGTTTADLFTATANTQQTVWFAAGITGVYSTVYSAYVKAGTATWLNFTLWDGAGVLGGGIQVWFNLSTGAVGSSVVGAGFSLTGTSTESVGAGWYRIAIAGTATGGTFVPAFRITDSNGVNATTATNGKTFYIWGAQLEDITGRADQTTPSEYVSVGVESAPYYHGSFVDGVKCFPTDISWNPIPLTTLLGYSAEGARTNLCLQSNAFTTTWGIISAPTITQNVVGPDGATSAWTLTDDSGIASEGIAQSILLTAAAHTFSVFVKKTTGAQTSYPVVYAASATHIAPITIDTSNGVATVWSAYTGFTIASGLSATCTSFNDNFWRAAVTFTASAANWSPSLIPAGTTNATQSTGTLDATAQGSAVFYGAQVELGSFASSYIATTTVAVARNADVESVSTSNNIAAATGSVYLEYTPTHSPSGTIAFWGTYVDASNYTAILHDATNLIFRKRIAGVNYDATIANAFVSGTTYKACATWGTSGTSITLNGTEGTPHANTTAAQIGSTMQWGADGNSLQQPFANIRNCRDWLRQLSASERTAVTA